MTLPFFYESAIALAAGPFQLSEETSKHCIQVLRMKTGERLQLTDGKGTLYQAAILQEDKKKAIVRIEESLAVPPRSNKISLAISLLKNTSRFEWFLEKATEIGISEIYPVICERTEHTRFRLDRMNQLLVSAMLQSQQAWLPLLHEPLPYSRIVQDIPGRLQLIAHCEDGQKNEIPQLPPFSDVLMLIGPEGDFSPAEIRMALNSQFLPVSLGNTRLRAETAGVVAAALLVNK